jgi:hypothetical protein
MVTCPDDNSQSSLIKLPAESQTSLIASGGELDLALRGTRQEIRQYLNEVRASQGRAAMLVSTDLIYAEKKGRQLARLTEEGRILNPSDPGGPGTAAEHVALLRVMAADISYYADASAGPTLCVHQRWLCEFDRSLTPPAVRLASVSGFRECFTRLMDMICEGADWDFYYRTKDLNYFGHEEFGEIPMPNWDPVRSLEGISDEGIRQAQAARRWPDVATSADILASLNESAAVEAETAEQRAARRLREILAARGTWEVGMGTLAQEIGWPGNVRALASWVERMAAAGEILVTRPVTASGKPRREAGTGRAILILTTLIKLTKGQLTRGDGL